MNVADEAIRAENVVKTFGTITALAGVSLSVGWVVAFISPLPARSLSSCDRHSKF